MKIKSGVNLLPEQDSRTAITGSQWKYI